MIRKLDDFLRSMTALFLGPRAALAFAKVPRNLILAIAVLVCSSQFNAALASTLQIQFTGVDIRYDGDTDIIHDNGDPALAGGSDTSKADGLLNMDFLVDGSGVGTLGADIYLDLEIPEVTGLPKLGGSITTDGSPSGTLELLMPGVGLSLSLGEAEIGFLPFLGGTINFVFGGAVASIDGQSLPFGLEIGDPVSVSFSTQVVAGTLTDDGDFITGFDSRGTGEVQGLAIPEPSTIFLAALGLFTVVASRRRIS